MSFSPSSAINQYHKVTGGNEDSVPVEGKKSGHIVPFVLIVTYIFLALMVILSASYLLFFSGVPLSRILTGSDYVYFYFLLLLFEVPGISLFGIVITVIFLYALFTTVIGFTFNSHVRPFDNPNGFFGMMAPLLFLLSAFIILIEESLQIPIGGPTIITTGSAYSVYKYFLNLIYAPFMEELGFRILPIGIVTFIPFILYTRRKTTAENGRPFDMNAFKAFGLYILSPGYMRKKYGGRNKYADFTMIIVTSEFFAYAHIYFGLWSWGKILPVFIGALILAVGYLKFGVYMDIMLHFFLNAASGLLIAFPSSIGFIILLVLWSVIGSLIAIPYCFTSMWKFFSVSKNNEFFMKS